MPATPLEEVSFYVGRLYYHYLGLLEQVLASHGLAGQVRPGMGQILFALFKADDRIISEIAAELQLSASTMTDMLRRMERAGLVARRRDDADRRAIRICLTEAGRSIRQRCQNVRAEINRVLTADLSAAEVKVAKQLMERMIAAVREHEVEAQPATAAKSRRRAAS